jgi:hypothetical protein
LPNHGGCSAGTSAAAIKAAATQNVDFLSKPADAGALKAASAWTPGDSDPAILASPDFGHTLAVAENDGPLTYSFGSTLRRPRKAKDRASAPDHLSSARAGTDHSVRDGTSSKLRSPIIDT